MLPVSMLMSGRGASHRQVPLSKPATAKPSSLLQAASHCWFVIFIIYARHVHGRADKRASFVCLARLASVAACG
jgi:hypothetical protein